MTYRIAKRFTFDAAHRVEGLPDDHKCARPHGHTYTVEIELAAEDVDRQVGFLRDFGDLNPIRMWIDDMLDHRDLNDVLSINPTAENLARHIFDMWSDEFPEMHRVTVWETPKAWASYER